MKDFFAKAVILDQDCYVVDLTRQSDNVLKVEILTSPYEDDLKYVVNGVDKILKKEEIRYFCLKKKNRNQKLPYLAVNLENYPAFIKGIDNCECVFASLSECNKPWVLFLETKYCLEKNIKEYCKKAFSQMENILKKLENENLVDRNKKRIYFSYSAPGYDELAPFNSFIYTQDELTEIKKQGINLLYYNTILIAAGNALQAPT